MTQKLTFALALTLIYGCAPKSDESPCIPNFQGSGMALRVEKLRDNQDGTSSTYLFKLCEDAKPHPTVFSVYGIAAGASTVTNPTSSVRAPSVRNSSYSGAQFEVDFRSFDLKFVVHQDMPTSTGYVYDTSVEMVRGELSQAIFAGNDPEQDHQ
jgi:hypothetical protein